MGTEGNFGDLDAPLIHSSCRLSYLHSSGNVRVVDKERNVCATPDL